MEATRDEQRTDRRRTDTRERVRRTALELFTTQGYESTGLAQVAERLGITRSAVYHHFGSKEELVGGSYEELRPALEAIVAAAESTGAARADVLRRLDDLLAGTSGQVLACLHVNEYALRGLPAAVAVLADLDRLAVALGGESVVARMRGRLALGALVQAHARGREVGGTLDERRQAAREIAEDLLA